MFGCIEVILQLSPGGRYCLVKALLLIFQRADLQFSTSREVQNTQNHCSHIIFKRIDGDVMNAGFG